jgi:hypothetical protein
MQRKDQQMAFLLAALVAVCLVGCTSGLAQSNTAQPTAQISKDATAPISPTVLPTQAVGDEADPLIEGETEVIDWGEEIGIEKVIELAKSGGVFEIQWHVMPNVIRVLMNDGGIFHYKNESTGVDIIKTLEDAGVKTGKEGVAIRFSFCN